MIDYKKFERSRALKVSRREMKYFVSIEDFYYLKRTLPIFLNEDPYNIDGGYRVRSLYFDSLDNMDFHSKLNGEKNRKKIRLRTYDPNSDSVKLEVKYKFDVNQRKESLIISKDHAKEIINENFECLLNYDDILAQKVYGMMTVYNYKPAVTVEYKRLAFFHKEYGIRTTLDFDIYKSETEFDIFKEEMNLNPVFAFPESVLEVKYDRYLYKWFSDILENCNPLNSAISKYCHSRQIYENFLA